MHSRGGYIGEQGKPEECNGIGRRVREGISQRKRRISKAIRGRRRQRNV